MVQLRKAPRGQDTGGRGLRRLEDRLYARPFSRPATRLRQREKAELSGRSMDSRRKSSTSASGTSNACGNLSQRQCARNLPRTGAADGSLTALKTTDQI